MTSSFQRLLILPFLLSGLIFSFTVNGSERPEKTTVFPSTKGVALKSEGSVYWLEFDTNANTLWPVLKEFWSTQGIELEVEQPAPGYMQTKWINDAELSALASSVLFSDSEPEFRERFRLRIEQRPNNAGSRVFIHHTSYGILLDEEAVYTGYLPPSPQLEIEMLSRLALFAGADKNKTHQATAQYRPVQLQARAADNNTYEIHVPGTAEFVRKALIQTLDRIDVSTETTAEGNIIASRTSTSILDNPDAAKEKEEWGIDDSSDLEEAGFDDSDTPPTGSEKPPSDTYMLRLTENTSDTLISISNHSANKDGDIKAFSEAVARNLNR
ncbi:MAG TPA: outer membrane protein assembly factor BamC [Gammaproteobacteria bacterium]|nr:outer membrane protein assembly factor BamC [Gammaproteobacteria bacterium]